MAAVSLRILSASPDCLGVVQPLAAIRWATVSSQSAREGLNGRNSAASSVMADAAGRRNHGWKLISNPRHCSRYFIPDIIRSRPNHHG